MSGVHAQQGRAAHRPLPLPHRAAEEGAEAAAAHGVDGEPDHAARRTEEAWLQDTHGGQVAFRLVGGNFYIFIAGFL